MASALEVLTWAMVWPVFLGRSLGLWLVKRNWGTGHTRMTVQRR